MGAAAAAIGAGAGDLRLSAPLEKMGDGTKIDKEKRKEGNAR